MIKELQEKEIPHAVVFSTPFGLDKTFLDKDVFCVILKKDIERLPTKYRSKWRKTDIFDALMEHDMDEVETREFLRVMHLYNSIHENEYGVVYELYGCMEPFSEYFKTNYDDNTQHQSN